MTESELVEAWGLFLGNSQTGLGLYLSILSGYLIIAYLVGAKLTRLQVWIVTTLFIWSSASVSLWFAAWWGRALEFALEAKKLNPERQVDNSPEALLVFTLMLWGGIVASLFFMWSVRHPKTE